jgi:hypothetical protein
MSNAGNYDIILLGPLHRDVRFKPTFLKKANSISMMSVILPLLTFECMNQSLWNLVCTRISWHLSISQRLTSKIPPISLCLQVNPSYRRQAKTR